jgi:cyclohexanecarboxylate-CoA ligase
LLDTCAERAPEDTAVVQGDHRLSYHELHDQANRFAAWLQAHGLRDGDVATMQMPNWWEAIVVYQGLSRLGCVINPVVPIYRDRELAFILNQAQPKAVVIPHRFRDLDYVEMFVRLLEGLSPSPLVIVVRPEGPLPDGFVPMALPPHAEPVAPAGQADDICLLLYTSGTTADPKGVLHSHNTLLYEVQSMIDLWRLDSPDKVFMPSPVTHITGFLYGFLLPTMTGGSVVLLDRWDPAVAVDLIQQEACRFTAAATPFLNGIVDEYARRGCLSTLRIFLCGGADVPPTLVRRAAEVLACNVARVYGSSEFPTYCCGRPGDGPEICADTDGIPIGPVEGRLDHEQVGIGELLVKGPDLFLGYLDPSLNDAAFTEDGFFRTGDLASIDEQGAVTIRGREKDIIIRGGENISAKEVEDLLYGHPLIRDVAVVAMSDPVMVERACAFVVLADDTTITLEDIGTYLSEQRIARQKFPERLEVIEELPMTASGKVQKYLLREMINAKIAGERQGD